MKMDYSAEIIRGWPFDGSLDRNEPIKAGVTLVNGDWVEKQADGTVDKVADTETGRAGLVIQGNGDSGSSVNSKKAVVLWGNFIAKLTNYDTAATFAPGVAVAAKDGKVTLATGTDAVGFVLDVVTSGSNSTAHLVVKVA